MKIKAKENIHSQIEDESMNPTLSIGKIYCVIGIEDDYFRIVDDIGDPVLFKKSLFEIIDSTIPDDWIAEVDEYGELFIYPSELSGFSFEEYFDDVSEAIEVFEVFRRKYKLPPRIDMSKAMH